MGQKKRPNIVSVHLSPQAKGDLDKACSARGMTIKSLLGRLVGWFVDLDKTEQSIVLGQIEETDVTQVASIVGHRRPRKTTAAAKGARGARRR
jgi:hypothetical protein